MILPDEVKEAYPFTSRTLPLGGQSYHYVDEGAGDPVVMVHGNPTWSFYFRKLVRALRATHRVIAPDHIGCGLSSRPSSNAYSFSLAQRVNDFAQLIDHLALPSRITLVLHDWGGMIGMAYAARYPERIGRLVLMNTAAFRLPATKSLPMSLKLCRTPALGALLVRGLNAFSRGAVHTCVTKRMPRAARAGYLAPYRSWNDRRAVHRFVQDIPLSPDHPSWAEVVRTEEGLAAMTTVPTLVMWGAQDFVFDDHFLEEWRRRLPHAEVHRFADAGHYVLEDAWERIVPLTTSFLARHPLSESC